MGFLLNREWIDAHLFCDDMNRTPLELYVSSWQTPQFRWLPLTAIKQEEDPLCIFQKPCPPVTMLLHVLPTILDMFVARQSPQERKTKSVENGDMEHQDDDSARPLTRRFDLSSAEHVSSSAYGSSSFRRAAMCIQDSYIQRRQIHDCTRRMVFCNSYAALI